MTEYWNRDESQLGSMNALTMLREAGVRTVGELRALIRLKADHRPATEAAPHCEGCHEWGCPGLVSASDSNPFPHIRRLSEVMAQPAPVGVEERVSEPWRYADGDGD